MQALEILVGKRLRWIAAALCLCVGSARASVCDYPTTSDNPVYTYVITYSPVVAGTVKVEYFTALVCNPYVTYIWDSLKGPYSISVLEGSPVYVRITVTAADHSPASVIYYFAPPNAPKAVVPAAPTGFEVT